MSCGRTGFLLPRHHCRIDRNRSIGAGLDFQGCGVRDILTAEAMDEQHGWLCGVRRCASTLGNSPALADQIFERNTVMLAFHVRASDGSAPHSRAWSCSSAHQPPRHSVE
jgi:hypothetical protein